MSALPRDPTLDDLTPWCRRAFDGAYRARTRNGDEQDGRHISRADFAAGWLAALLWLRSTSSFDEAANR